MQRSVLRLEKEKTAEEQQHIIDDEHWVIDLPETQHKESKYITEPSYSRCENLIFGRLSFKGFNPEVEKLMKSQNQSLELEEAERRENEINVGDQEMTQRYESLIGTISKKFATKRQRQTEQGEQNTSKSAKKSKKFMKPAEDG